MLIDPALLRHPLLALTPLMLLCHYLHTYTHASSPSIGFDSLWENSASKSPLKVELHAAIFCSYYRGGGGCHCKLIDRSSQCHRLRII